MRVLIVGGGTAGWMSAAALARVLPPGTAEIQLVESEAIGTVGVGEATVPHIRFFNAKLGIDEADFMARTAATFKLGIEFANWSRPGERYIHPFGAFGRDLDGLSFHQLWTRAFHGGKVENFQHYSLPIMAARQGKFMHPADDPEQPLSGFSYAYQFDASLYAAYLRRFAESLGVRRTEGKIVDVALDAESGFVDSVVMASGERLSADLFVDCSGFRGLLIEESLNTGYESWSHWLPCDRAYAVPCAGAGSPDPYTRATAHEAGWFWRIPLQHRVGNGHVYSSRFTSDESAVAALVGQLESTPQAEPRQLRFTTGKRRRQWSRNVVAIGLSAGFLEPLESTSIHLIQLAIGHLIDLFPDRQFDPMSEIEFNRIMALEYERIRDFLILHYHATEREDTEFWRYCKNMDIPESLSLRMELFRKRGVVVKHREGMFLDPSWHAVFIGQNVIPEHYDPWCERVSDHALREHLQTVATEFNQAVDAMPAHLEFIRRIGATHEPSH